MESTKSGYMYYTWEDFNDICEKCQMSQYGDFMYVDCGNCNLVRIVDLCSTYARHMEDFNKFNQ